MNDPVVITLEGAPVGKGRARSGYTFAGARVHYTPYATRVYENALRQMATLAMRHRPPINGPVELKVEAHFPVPSSWSKAKQAAAESGQVRPTGKPDADNILKACDALNCVVWNDDSQVVDARVVKLYSRQPRLVITVREAA